MPYTVSHKPQATSLGSFASKIYFNYTVVDSFHQSDNLVPDLIPDLAPHRRQPSYQNQQLPPLLPIKRQPRLVFNLKRCLALMPWLLLPYATTTQALSATTAQVIHGTQPYLTFDNGVTKVTTTEGLLGITLYDRANNKITYDSTNNTSTETDPIILPDPIKNFDEIHTLVPLNTDTTPLSAVIADNRYWGDDDGDGEGDDGISVIGNLKINIIDAYGKPVDRRAKVDICKAPFKVTLTSTAGSLTTKYGINSSGNFTGSSASYYVSTKTNPTVCYARPNLSKGQPPQDGPHLIWNTIKGFSVQSENTNSYNTNFPTTGSSGLFFDLIVLGTDNSLVWPDVSRGGITANMTPNPPIGDAYFNPEGASTVRVTLRGPEATYNQWNSTTPGRVSFPVLPQQFELVGYDSNNTAVVKYGFVIKQWFVNRGSKGDSYPNMLSWCNQIGYRMADVKDLTNAYSTGGIGWETGSPAASGNYFQRNIGAGFFTEWGTTYNYITATFIYVNYWTNTPFDGSNILSVGPNNGELAYAHPNTPYLAGICSYP